MINNPCGYLNINNKYELNNFYIQANNQKTTDN